MMCRVDSPGQMPRTIPTPNTTNIKSNNMLDVVLGRLLVALSATVINSKLLTAEIKIVAEIWAAVMLLVCHIPCITLTCVSHHAMSCQQQEMR